MKIIILLRWLIGIFFCLVSIVGFVNGDTVIAIFIFGLGLFIIPPVYNYLRNSKNNESNILENPNLKRKNNDNVNVISLEINENELFKSSTEKNYVEDNDKFIVMHLTDFFGSIQYSQNKQFCVSYCDGHYEYDKWKNGDIALLEGRKLLFKKKIERPNDCYVSNDGIVICCDWKNTTALAGNFLVFNKKGELIFSKKTTANLGACAISDDSKIAIFETMDSDTADANKIFILDIEKKEIIHKFQRPASFNNAVIDTEKKLIKLIDHREFAYEIDFEGNHTNLSEYENQILTKGSIIDCLWLYEEKENEIKYNDLNYLKLLNSAISDKEAIYSYGLDKIYRKIGEYYEANKDIQNTINYWNMAIQINPKIGIKRKLEQLKKNNNID